MPKRSLAAMAAPDEPAPMAPTAPMGRMGRVEAPGGRFLSARLNPDIANNVERTQEGLQVVVESQPPPVDVLERMMSELEIATEETNAELGQLGISRPKFKKFGGARRYRGGDDELLYELLDTERVAIVTTAATAIAYKAGQITQEAAIAAAGPSQAYLSSRLGKMGPRLQKLGSIVLTFADRSFQLPVTAANVAMASLGFTVNFVSYIFDKVNTWGEQGADYLLSDDTAKKAADAATNSIKSVGATAAVGVVAANQLGVLPLSAVLAAVLFTIQSQLGTGAGRAYLITGFYAWYRTKSSEEQQVIKAAAEEYAEAAKEAAKTGIAAAKPGIKKAADTLGGLLSKKSKVAASSALAAAGAGGTDKNAVQAMVTEQGAPAGGASVDVADIPAVLVSGAAAAGLAVVANEKAPLAVKAPAVAAAEAVAARAPRRARGALPLPLSAQAPAFVSRAAVGEGDGAASAMDERGGRRRKTKKVKSKRRVTRRRKVTKVLGTPVFIY